MKNPKIILVLLVVLCVSVFAAAPVLARGEDMPPAGNFPMPAEVQALIAAFVGYLVTQGIKTLSKLLGSDLGGWSAVITAAAVTTVVYFLQALLSAVPAATQPIVLAGLSLLVSILGAFGIHGSLKLAGGRSQ